MASKFGRANPLLTRLSLARRNSADSYVAEHVAPSLKVGPASFGEYYEFNEKNNMQLPENQKASGGVSRELTMEAALLTFKTVEYGSRMGYTQRELNDFGGPELALQRVKMNIVTDSDMNAHEKRVGDLVTTAGSYATANKKTLTGANQWNDISSDPFGDVVDGKVAINNDSNVEPNAMVVSYTNFWTGLATHPDILSRVQAQQKDSGLKSVTPALVGSLLDLDLRVARARFISSNPGQATVTKASIWGNFALIFHKTPTPAKEIISLAYTFALQNFVMRTYFDEPSKKTFVDNDHDVQTKLIAAGVGFLITTPTAT